MVSLQDFGRPENVEIPSLPGGEAHVVTLDGRAMATPFGNLIVIPGSTLAHGLAGEWMAQVRWREKWPGISFLTGWSLMHFF